MASRCCSCLSLIGSIAFVQQLMHGPMACNDEMNRTDYILSLHTCRDVIREVIFSLRDTLKKVASCMSHLCSLT
jgi:hypothetical protein